jgi:hypothetical protein
MHKANLKLQVLLPVTAVAAILLYSMSWLHVDM